MSRDRAYGNRVAFVVGIAAYKHAKPLGNAVNDARAVGAKLEQLGFAVMGGSGGPGEDLDRSAAFQSFDAFCEAITPGGTALIYYAGHGLQIDDQNYLVPADARLDVDNPLIELVPLRPMIERAALKAGSEGTVIVFLDSCREDPFSPDQIRRLAQSARALDPVRAADHPYSIVNHGFATLKMRPGEGAARTFISFATAPGEFAYDGKGDHSPFSAALLDHLGTRGLALDDFIDRIGLDVLDRAERDGLVQDPWYETNLQRPFYFYPRTLRPIGELAGLGLIAGLITCILLVRPDAQVGDPFDMPRLWGLGLPFGLVVAFGTLRWGSGRWWHAAVAVIITMAAFALALWIMQTPVAKGVGQPEGPAQLTRFARFFADPSLVGISLLALLAGVSMTVVTALGCKPQLASFRGFSATTGALCIGLLLGGVFLGYVALKDLAQNAVSLPGYALLMGLGALWFAAFGAQLGFIFALYVAEHRRIPGRR